MFFSYFSIKISFNIYKNIIIVNIIFGYSSQVEFLFNPGDFQSLICSRSSLYFKYDIYIPFFSNYYLNPFYKNVIYTILSTQTTSQYHLSSSFIEFN